MGFDVNISFWFYLPLSRDNAKLRSWACDRPLDSSSVCINVLFIFVIKKSSSSRNLLKKALNSRWNFAWLLLAESDQTSFFLDVWRLVQIRRRACLWNIFRWWCGDIVDDILGLLPFLGINTWCFLLWYPPRPMYTYLWGDHNSWWWGPTRFLNSLGVSRFLFHNSDSRFRFCFLLLLLTRRLLDRWDPQPWVWDVVADPHGDFLPWLLA